MIRRPPGALRRRPSRRTDLGRPPNRTRKPAPDRYRWAAGARRSPRQPRIRSAAGRRVAGRHEANATDRAPTTRTIENRAAPSSFSLSFNRVTPMPAERTRVTEPVRDRAGALASARKSVYSPRYLAASGPAPALDSPPREHPRLTKHATTASVVCRARGSAALSRVHWSL